MDDETIGRLEKGVDRVLQELISLRKDNRRLADDRRRLEEEVRRLREVATSQRGAHDVLSKLKKENDHHKRNARLARDQVERMLSRFQTLEE